MRDRYHFKDPVVYGGIIFKWIFKKEYGGEAWT
jgi:hypothetical protein